MDQYTKYVTGEDVGSLLRQFNPREGDEQFKQRKDLTQAVTSDMANRILSPMYKIGRSRADVLINWKSAILGVLAFISYVFIYTPLKQKTPWAVFVGAFPGAIPPLLGAIAHTNAFGFEPGVLFFVQFTWQFPHFWAIAWVLYDDYKKAGFSLLPSRTGRSKYSAFQIMLYALALIPFSLVPWLLGWTGIYSLIIASVLGIGFFLYAYKLYHSLEVLDARKLMFASFVYLPIIQFVYVFDRTI
jgi:protoheme IX farnesyltransferase